MTPILSSGQADGRLKSFLLPEIRLLDEVPSGRTALIMYLEVYFYERGGEWHRQNQRKHGIPGEMG